MFPKPCHNPLFRSGIRSLETKVLIDISPPPPMPATTRPNIMTHSDLARPHIRFPAAKKMLLNMRPARLPKMSVRRPESGWSAALAMRYADASQETSVNELKEVDIGAASVATTVPSIAPRKTPIHMLPKVYLVVSQESFLHTTITYDYKLCSAGLLSNGRPIVQYFTASIRLFLSKGSRFSWSYRLWRYLLE